MIAAAQHGVLDRGQLLALGFSNAAIRWRLDRGRLHRTPYPGVYVVGRPTLSREARWLATVRFCGPGAALSHGSAAALWAIGIERTGLIEVSVSYARRPRHSEIRAHRRTSFSAELVVVHRGVPVTSPALTIIDMAPRLSTRGLEAAISEADALGLVNPEALREVAVTWTRVPGAARVRETLDRRTFRLTRSELERRFLPLAAELGMPVPETRVRVNGYEVDFFWHDHGLVVETDGLTYHRTPAQQAKDSVRDHAHVAAGLIPLRFTHAQVRYDPGYVKETLGAVRQRAEIARPAA